MQRHLSIFRHLLTSNFKELIRDPLSVLFSFFLPLFFIIAFGVTSSVMRSVSGDYVLKIGVVGTDGVVLHAFQALSSNRAFLTEKIVEGDGADALRSGRLQALVRSANAPEPSLEILTTEKMQSVGVIVSQILRSTPAEGGAANAGWRGAVVRLGTVAARQENYFGFLFPSIIALSLLQVGLFGTAAPIVNAKEKGMYKYYDVIPMPRSTLLAAQVTVRLVMALAQVAILLGVGCLMFEVSIAHPLLLLPILLLGSVMLVMFGFAIAGFFGSSSIASGVLTLLNFYCMFFGQIFVDLSQFSLVKWLVLTTPVVYLSDCLRHSITGGQTMFSLSTNMAGMISWLLLSLLVGQRYFRMQPRNP